MTYIAIGCSFTEDMYPSHIDPWPEQLSYMIDSAVINYGVRGSGLNYAARTMYHSYYRHKPKGYFIGLSQWDRKEIGEFRSIPSARWSPLKTKHMRPQPNDTINMMIKDYLGLSEYESIDAKWCINQAAYNVLSMINFCKNHNLELYIHQLLWPLHIEYGQLSSVRKLYEKSLWPEITKQIDWVENDVVLFDEEWNFNKGSKRSTSMNKVVEEAVKNKNIDLVVSKFTSSNTEHTLGFHNLPGSNGDYKNTFDVHPNQKGHEMIANIFYEKWKNGQSINA